MALGSAGASGGRATHPAVLRFHELPHEEAHGLGLGLCLAAGVHLGPVALQREEEVLQAFTCVYASLVYMARGREVTYSLLQL